MKKIFYSAAVLLLTTNFLLLSTNSLAQSPWLWAKSSGGGNRSDDGTSVSTDGSGNVLVTGYFRDSAITFGTTTLINNAYPGGNKMFIVKYNPSGNVLWAKSTGGSSGDYSQSVATDGSGNVLVTGYFQGPAITFGTITLSPVGDRDIFIVKYDVSGNVLWAKRAGGPLMDWANSVAVDGSGNILVTGFFRSSTITFGTSTLTNVGGSDMFIVKYDASGNVLWAKSTGGSCGESIAADGSGNVLVTGFFGSPTVTFGTSTLTNAGTYNMFIVKYNPSGNVLWAKSAGGNLRDYGYSIARDGSVNVLVTGYFISPTITFGTNTLTNTGGSNLFIVKYDVSGNVLWAKSANGNAGFSGYGGKCNSVATDGSGNAWVTGCFWGSTITFGTNTLTNGNGNSFYENIFIVKYDASGNVLWAESVGEDGSDDAGNSVATDGSGNVLVTGHFGGPTITFGTTTLTNGKSDMFIAKLGTLTGVENLEKSEGIFIYPNPFTTQATFSFSKEVKNPTLLIYDLAGKEVMQSRIPSGAKNITVERGILSSGMYFYQIFSDEKVISKGKLVVSN